MLPRVGFLLGTYLLGSIPTGILARQSMERNRDIRDHGSGNLGATNVLRVLGPRPAIFTFTVDCLKGMGPVLLSQHVFPDELLMPILTGLAAIIGHTTSVFVRFHRGGKGMATGTGVFIALLPVPSLVAIPVFIGVTTVTRYVSLGSIVGALTLVASSFYLFRQAAAAGFWTTAVVAVFVIWKHRANIQRLMNGTENRITWGRKHHDPIEN